jgi:hypothetical protein
MTYTVNFSNILKSSITVSDGTTNKDTSLNLIGRNSSNFGVKMAENFLHLLENFANSTAPSPPIEGQLWFDTSQPTSKQLRVYDGANWVPSGGLHQASTAPTNIKLGDIWVDTSSGQLNIWSGSQWLLVGPSNAGNRKTGTYATTLFDSLGDNSITHDVVITYINDAVVTILTTEEFIPNPLIPGFSKLVPGINLSTYIFSGTTAKLTGYADVALSLKTSSSTDPVIADNFLRSDTAGTINGFLNINSNSGIKIGAVTQTVRIEKAGNNMLLSNRYSGGSIVLSVIKNNTLNEIVTVNGNTLKVGINNISPTVELDVIGSGKYSGNLSIAGNVNISNTSTVAKSVSVGENLKVTGVTTLTGMVTVGAGIQPTTANSWDLGNVTTPFKRVFANEFVTTSTAFSMVPTGTIMIYAGGVLPNGWLPCDGAVISVANYPRLYAAISTAYGTPDDGLFCVPQLNDIPAINVNVSVTMKYMIKY